MAEHETNGETMTARHDRNGTRGYRARSFLPWRRDTWRSPLDAVALLAVVGSFWVVAGTDGLVVGAALVVLWYLLPTIAVFAAGAVALVGLVPSESPMNAVGIPAIALSGLLLSNILGTGSARDLGTLVAAGVVVGGLGGVTLVGTDAAWMSGLVLLITTAAGYVAIDILALSRLRSIIHE